VSWLSWFDDNCENYFIKHPSDEQLKAMRGGSAAAEAEAEPEQPEAAVTADKVKEMTENVAQQQDSTGIAEFIPLDQELITKVNEPKLTTFGELLSSKKPTLVGIYFSMHNCPPCREFTPLLADLYTEFNEDKHQIEIVFFSGDKTQEEFDEYFKEMPWVALPRSSK